MHIPNDSETSGGLDVELPATQGRAPDDDSPLSESGATEQRRHAVLVLDTGGSGAATLCAMIATDVEGDTACRHLCTDTVSKVPVVLRRVPRLCESLTAEEEVAQTLLLQQDVAAAAALKLVLVVEYAVVQMGPSGASGALFALLVERAAAMLRDAPRFGSALGLVCCKVPAQAEAEDIKREVASFLKSMLQALGAGTPGCHWESVWRARCSSLVSCLVEGGADRVALLRDSDAKGDHADDVLRLLWEATRWERLQPGDVGRTLPLWVRPNIARLVASVQEAVSAKATEAVEAAKAHVRDQLAEAEPEVDGPALLQQLWDDGDGWCCGDVAAVRGAVDETRRRLEELHRLQAAIEDDVVSRWQQLVTDSKKAVEEYLRLWVLFLQLLTELGEYVWGYEVQSRPWDFDVRDVEDWDRGRGCERGLVVSADNVHSFLRLLAKKSGIKSSAALAGLELEPLMLQRLNGLLDEALRHKVAVTRRGSVVVVTGTCIVLTNVLDHISKALDGQLSPCEERSRAVWSGVPTPPPAPTAVWLIAQDTVFIDREWNAGRLKVAVVAPHWHVVDRGSPAFLLNGAPAVRSTSPASAGRDACVVAGQSAVGAATATLAPGRGGGSGGNGLAGGAGQAAGAFFGVAMHIVDGHLLTVSACGGDGASGQDGGAGGDGEDGQDAVGAYVFTKPKAAALGELNHVVTLLYNQQSRKFHGSAGGPGGQGGNGGRGGAGGRAGEVVILSPRSSLGRGVNVVAHDGKHGAAGLGGRGGRGGRNGKDCTARRHFVLFLTVGVSTDDDDDQPDSFAAKGDLGEAGGSVLSCPPGELDCPEPAEALDEEEKDAAMGAFVTAFSSAPPPASLPWLRRKTFADLLGHARRGWRWELWYQQRTGWAAASLRRSSSVCSSFRTCASSVSSTS